MPVEFRLEWGELRYDGGGGRRLNGEDHSFLQGMVRRYRTLAGRHAEAELLALGSELASWLNGPDGWLSAAVDGSTRPLFLEFGVPFTPSAEEQAFLAAPWELLALGGSFLADRETLGFSPVRRLGP